jgi:hypothetical protein
MAGPRPISIWQPRSVDGGLAWVRPDPSPLGDHHAAERELRPRRGPLPRRVCLFGESAAAGYLFAPHLTPARVLAAQLREIAGPERYEVIDLARTNETLAGLVATVEAALQLEPDLLVLFAGNNWSLLETPEVSPYAPSAAARETFAQALAQAGPAGPVGLARRTLDERARAALDRIAELAGRARIGVVVVIPEVNLADWESRQPPVWLPGDGTARWYGLLDDALAALDRGDPAAAEEAAWRMNELDGSTGPVPFRLLARAWAAQCREAEARDVALAEVDSVHYPLLCFLGAPQATTAARALLAGAAERHGWAAVDLRPLFAAWTGSALPGRRLFLDYCHLTAEGMHVAMAAAAAEILRRAPAPGAPREVDGLELARRLPPPEITPEAEATARLGAALHGAHRLLPVGRASGPGSPILEHWCSAALEASSGVAQAMLDLAHARLAPLPAILTAAARRNLASPYPLGLQHGLRWEGLDGEVLEAMTAALRRAGRPEASEIEAALAGAGAWQAGRAETGSGLGAAPGWGQGVGAPTGTGIDLARGARFLAEPLARFYPEAMDLRDLPGRAFLRCPWPETGFWLPARAAAPAVIQLTARLPPIPGAPGCRRGPIELRVNGQKAAEAPLAERWTRATLRLPAEALHPGLNRITLRWPMPPPVGEQALQAARRRLAQGIEADLHPVFGEVFSLRVRASAL